MTEMAATILVIYEKNGKEWATYLAEVMTSHLHLCEIVLCNLDQESEETLENLSHAKFNCKLIILTSYLLEIFYRNQASHFFQCLHPSHRLVLLLCGVESPEGFYEIFPLERNCHVILSEQDPQEYISVVSSVINEDCKDKSLTSPNASKEVNWGTSEPEEIQNRKTSVLVLPKRISCENPDEIFIIMQEELPSDMDVEVEFCTEKLVIRRQPLQWNEKILCLKAEDFPPGPVTVNVYCGKEVVATTQVEYYSIIQDLKLLLYKVADPVTFICQAFDVHTLEDLDKVLAKSLKNRISSCDFTLQEIKQQAINASSVEIPTILHCAAKLGLKEVALILLQSSIGADICHVPNKYGDNPAAIAEKHGHKDIQEIILHLAEKVKAERLDAPSEQCDLQQEEVYVAMDKRADADQHSAEDVCTSGQKGNANVFCRREPDAWANPGVNKEEEIDERHAEYNATDDRSLLIDDYCCSIPADSPSGPFTNDGHPHVLQDVDKKWVSGASSKFSSENKQSCHETNAISGSRRGNIYVPLPAQSSIRSRHIQKDGSNSESPGPDQKQPEQFDYQGEDVNENAKYRQLTENPDEDEGNEYTDEPVFSASTDDDLYLVFEDNAPQGGWRPTIKHHAVTQKDIRYKAEEVKKDHDPREYHEEEHDNGWSEEPFVDAEDDMYIIFEENAKDTRQNSCAYRGPAASGITSRLVREIGTSHKCKEVREHHDDKDATFSSLREYHEEEHDNRWSEEPFGDASSEDDMYIIFDENRGPAASGITSKRAKEIGASHRFQGGQAGFTDSYFWDEDDEERNEEDPYSFACHDDLYMELPFEPDDEVNPRTKKSFIRYRAPAPAPRQEAAAPQLQPEDSYISRVFCQKPDERKIYGTGPCRDKPQMMKHEEDTMPQHHMHSSQDELILLQEKVKRGILTMDEAIHKFKQWQAEKSGLDVLQQKKLQQLREKIIGDKPDDDKLTIVHQPSPNLAKRRNTYGMFDNSIYQDTRNPPQPTYQHYPRKEQGVYGKLQYNK